MIDFRYLILILSILFFIASCDGNKTNNDKEIELALTLSGKNRPELEKVLNHYSADGKDSLKLKAAQFLIRNMIYHRSMSGEYVHNHIKTVDSLYDDIPLSGRAVYYTIPSRIDSLEQYVEMALDIENISADFLIKNIEYSFNIWENSVFEPKISFGYFCEYILPYKFGNEPLILWKDSVVPSYDECRDFDIYELNQEAVNTYNRSVNAGYLRLNSGRFKEKELRKYKEDNEISALKYFVINRTCGIPAVIDFVPFLNVKNNARNPWMTIIDNKYIDNNFLSSSTSFSSKVFRKTYSINSTPNDKNNFVPDFIKNPYNKDVTNIYQNVATVEYDFGKVSSNVKYAYLAVFYEGEWCEVAWAELKNGKAKFNNMGRNVVYMPLYYNGNNRVCVENAILLDGNAIVTEIGVIGDERRNIRLKRLTAYDVSGEYDIRRIIGTDIVAFNDSKSVKFDSISEVTHYKYMSHDTVNTNCDRKYKNWGLVLKDYASISELQFFDSHGQLIEGKYFNINQLNEIEYDSYVTKVISDGDILTYLSYNKCMGISCEKPTSVSYVQFMSSNDGNGVMPGNEYELFYFYNGDWVLLEKKVAADYEIEFSNVPTNAFFWLHDKSKKCDERPFTIHNDKIKFW